MFLISTITIFICIETNKILKIIQTQNSTFFNFIFLIILFQIILLIHEIFLIHQGKGKQFNEFN